MKIYVTQAAGLRHSGGSRYRCIFRTVLLLLALLLAGCHSTPPRVAPTETTPAVKLIVEEDGIYEVTAAELAAIGFDLTAADPATLALSSGGQPVAFQVIGRGQDRVIRFYGQGLGKLAYSPQNVYWLEAGPALGQTAVAVAEHAAVPAANVAFTRVVSATVHVEQQRQYIPKVPMGADPWLWESLLAPAETTIEISVPHPAPGDALLQVRVWGNSAAPADPDHHLTLTLNGTPVADARWDGMGEHVITATVPASVLREGANRLRLVAAGDTGAVADAILLDWAEITYPRQLVLDENKLIFEGQGLGFAVRVDDPPSVLWDITDPTRPIALTGYQVTNGELRFASDDRPRRFVIARSALQVGEMANRSGEKDTGESELRNWPGGADLIIVTVPQFRPALEPLVAARRTQGLRVAVVDVEAVYDSFNYGRADPVAIRDFVHYARAHWIPPAPRYLLLAGDASYDPAGYLKGSEADLVPTYLVDTGFSGRTASDVWYALADNGSEQRPVLAVGRFPAQTVAQMQAMVGKTLAYAAITGADPARDWRRRALFVADNEEPGFATAAEAFATTLSDYTSRVITVEGDGAQARAELLRALDEGIGLLGYFGHGSLTLWAKEKIFGVEDVPKLANRDRLPIVFTLTCLSGFFQHPVTPSLGEVLLRAPNGGAVAALVPSSAALLEDQILLSEALAQALTNHADENHKTLGETILAAQSALRADYPPGREILLTFNLLGDPTLEIGN